MVALVRLTSETISILGSGKILPAASAQALLQAEQLLFQAQRDAEALVDEARVSASRIQAAATEAGLKEAQVTIQQRLAAIAVESLRVMENNKERIVDLGLQIARRIIDTTAPDEAAVQIALRSLRVVGHSPVIRLRVAPSLVETVRGRVDDIVSAVTSRAVIEVVSDPRINDAGCILETDAGLVDATIESQLTLIESGLRKSLEASK
nr:FliH/SctL family protein [Bradyrhizobium sp. 2S1]MCK7664756.1 FliH/SctL family protein [Bradyrhizobium sp. 2S1]